MDSDNPTPNAFSFGSSSYSPKKSKTNSGSSNSGGNSNPNTPSSSPSPATTFEPPVSNASPTNPVVRGLPNLSSLGIFTINPTGGLSLHSKVVSTAFKSKSSPSSSSTSPSSDSVGKSFPIHPIAREIVFPNPNSPQNITINPFTRSLTVHAPPKMVSPASKSKSKSSPSSSSPSPSSNSVSKSSPINPIARQLVFSNPNPLRNIPINPSTRSSTVHASKVVSPASKSKLKYVPVHPLGFNFKQDIHRKEEIDDDMVVNNKTSDGKPKQETAMAVPSLQLTVVSTILHGIPQNPHFLPLKNYTAIARKNLMSRWHQIFEETVNQIKSLEVFGFWDNAKELWRSIEELQCMGYNVIPLRRRVVELTDVRNEFMVAEWEIKKLKIKGENHRMGKSWIESLILYWTEMANREQFTMEVVKIELSMKETFELPKIRSVFARLISDELVM